MSNGIAVNVFQFHKSGDLSDPNKWRGVMLMDVCSKIFSSVMNRRAFCLLNKNGTRFQFGGTLELGCWDGLFVLKTMLTMQKNHNLQSYVAFVDLIKTYDTANHELLPTLLEKYGAPPLFVSAVERMYQDLSQLISNLGRSGSRWPRSHLKSKLDDFVVI